MKKLTRDKRKLRKMKYRYYLRFEPAIFFGRWLSRLNRAPTQAELIRLDTLGIENK